MKESHDCPQIYIHKFSFDLDSLEKKSKIIFKCHMFISREAVSGEHDQMMGYNSHYQRAFQGIFDTVEKCSD